ncbi:dihydrofolate reductase family protein [Actinoplanes sp. LDG1-01]|uniref:Dihydrofolate reductase family protein n=1 Tax=Paractinoplanes lichenicola TaxID=2802976 RepID=A0ABS1VVN6_9ACTN|nr:dihydrofolate reductase family protein [Actinoplanes lichenicola]
MTVFQNVTLDGVMQAPGRKGEDDRGGFEHGGWADGYADEVSMGFAAEGMSRQDGALLFGRRTYEDLLGFWTTTERPNPFTDVLVNARKLVVTRSADTTAAYPNTELLVGDAVKTVAEHRETGLTIMGSGELIRALHAARMIDTYVLQIHPIVLGSGTKLFASEEDGERANLELERTIPTTTGVIIAQYAVR